jgi:3'-5' exoribonuclease
MPRTKPAIVALSAMEPGQYADCFALLIERKPGTTGTGKPFFTCRFRDAHRVATYMVWADGPFFAECEKSWQAGRCYKLRCFYTHHDKYGPQVEVQQIRPTTDDDRVDGFEPVNLVEQSRHDANELFKDLRALVAFEIANVPLRALVLSILDKNSHRLCLLPGSQNKYYPFAGGWVEHTLNVAKTCLHLADRYAAHFPDLPRPIDRNLLVAGAVLHDIGRVAEFDDNLLMQPTVESELIGHLFLGRDIVRDAARDMSDLNPELLLLLEHLIVSHLNLPAWGSPKLPLIPESLILFHADDLDAKVEMYARCLTRDISSGPFTDRDSILGRPLYKGMPAATAESTEHSASSDGNGPDPRP